MQCVTDSEEPTTAWELNVMVHAAFTTLFKQAP